MRDDPRPPRAAARGGRTLLGVVAVLLALIATGLVVVALNGDDATDEAVTIVEPEVAPRPSTAATALPTSVPTPSIPAPPVPAPPVTVSEADTSQPTTAADTSADTPDDEPQLSDLAALLGQSYSVVPEEITPRPKPVGLDIDAFDVSQFPVRPVGLEPDGQLEVPDETEIGWYRYGATSGRDGATVLAAHVSWNRTVGPFGALGTLDPGNRISVTLDDGSVREYEVFERAVYGKLELPRERIWRNTGPETLVLITCGGDFNPEIRRFRENIVVYATPVD